MRRQFDKAYYQRFYRNPVTRASTPQAAARLAAFIGAYLDHLGLRVSSVLDVGCGVGDLLRALEARYPKARIRGVEFSAYACERYGWEQGSAVDYTAKQPFDLVVCNDVVPYLDDAQAAAAIDNLATLTKTALFFGALTEEDWDQCDKRRTDPRQHQRSAAWYRRRLRRHFEPLGGGLHLKKPVDVVIWSLDQSSPA